MANACESKANVSTWGVEVLATHDVQGICEGNNNKLSTRHAAIGFFQLLSMLYIMKSAVNL